MTAYVTHFCCRSGGNNLNAGSLDGSSTEAGTSPAVTYTGGDWNSSTYVYTAPTGSDMSAAQVGRFASVYVDGDTAPTSGQWLVARITAVNSGARTVTLSSTYRSLYGTVVSTGTGTRSMRIGGAWAGPSGTVTFPFVMSQLGSLVNSSSYPCQVNIKNDQTYSMTAGITSSGGDTTVRGYSTSYCDGGMCTVQGALTGASYNALTVSGASIVWQDAVFKNNGATGTASGIYISQRRNAFYRIAVSGMKGSGIECRDACLFQEVECYSNDVNGFLAVVGSGVDVIRSMFCGNASYGINASASGSIAISQCVVSGNSSGGIQSTLNKTVISQCDVYNNGTTGINVQYSGASIVCLIESTNIIKHSSYGIVGGNNQFHSIKLFNVAFGAGTMANGTNISGVIGVDEVGSVTYDADTHPWTDPANGDFRISLAAANGAGRGSFLQTQSGKSGTVSYPDIGAGQTAISGGTDHFGNGVLFGKAMAEAMR